MKKNDIETIQVVTSVASVFISIHGLTTDRNTNRKRWHTAHTVCAIVGIMCVVALATK